MSNWSTTPSTTLAALMLLPGAIIGAGFAPFSGLILDKLGARKPILLGAAFILLAHFHFTLFGLKLTNGLILIFYMIFMTGMGLAFGNIMTNGQKQLSLDEQPDANAIFNTLQQFAGAVGTTLASLIVAMSQANQRWTSPKPLLKESQRFYGPICLRYFPTPSLILGGGKR